MKSRNAKTPVEVFRKEGFYLWQYFAPELGGGLVESSVGMQPGEEATRHILTLAAMRVGRKRLPKGCLVFPADSLGAALLRERIREEGLTEFSKV